MGHQMEGKKKPTKEGTWKLRKFFSGLISIFFFFFFGVAVNIVVNAMCKLTFVFL